MKLLHLFRLLSVLFLVQSLCSADMSLKETPSRRALCQQAFEELWGNAKNDPKNCTIHRQFFTHLYEKGDPEAVSRRDIRLSVIDGAVNFEGEEDGIVPKLPLFEPLAPTNYSITVNLTCVNEYCFSLCAFYNNDSDLPRYHKGSVFYTGWAKGVNGAEFSVVVPGTIHYPDDKDSCQPDSMYISVYSSSKKADSFQWIVPGELTETSSKSTENKGGVSIDFSKMGASQTLFVTFNEASATVQLSAGVR